MSQSGRHLFSGVIFSADFARNLQTPYFFGQDENHAGAFVTSIICGATGDCGNPQRMRRIHSRSSHSAPYMFCPKCRIAQPLYFLFCPECKGTLRLPAIMKSLRSILRPGASLSNSSCTLFFCNAFCTAPSCSPELPGIRSQVLDSRSPFTHPSAPLWAPVSCAI